ncbi:hypothetical protein [Candidatus Nitrosocosmicus hydrocola]|uniref:hypothetical protein n=1 Tax=Candidatus Nitrosocosmicus hydrocola TaxID=1826872 RepID=UPI0011E5A9EE|nr:hypothetical protein [Candidatus Nitrosocosmicus hydrocola]
MNNFLYERKLLKDLQMMKKLITSVFGSSNLPIIVFLLTSFASYTFFPTSFAVSPAFEPQALNDQRNDWIQTFGNDRRSVESRPGDLLEIDYLSDGKSLKATYWLGSDSQNASKYEQPFSKISYGMLIKIASYNINTGFQGADYNYYIESINGKWSEYLYQLSSTGSQVLLYSKINYSQTFGSPTLGPGYVKLNLNLSSIDNPREYGVLFYTKESIQSSEVSDFTDWVGVPPSAITIVTSPEDVVIEQGEQLLVPANIYSTFSNNVTDITFNRGSNDVGSEFNSSGLYATIERIHPPLFRIIASPQTPEGFYTIPFTASLFLETTLESFGALNNNNDGEGEGEITNSTLQTFNKFPSFGYVTNPSMNLTVTVIPPLSFDEQFKEFWSVYGQPISIIAGGFAGGFASLVFAKIKKSDKQLEDTKK